MTARELEALIKDLIVTQRAAAGCEAEIHDLLTEKDAFQKGAADSIAAAGERVASLESQYKGKVKRISWAESRGLLIEPFEDEVLQANQQLNTARAELEQADEFARSREVAWERLSNASMRPGISPLHGSGWGPGKGGSCWTGGFWTSGSSWTHSRGCGARTTRVRS